jgi:MMP 1-O-methyltransferase
MTSRTTATIASIPKLLARPDWSDPQSLTRVMELAEPIGRDGFARLFLVCDHDETEALARLQSAYSHRFGETGDLEVILTPPDAPGESFDAELTLAPSATRPASSLIQLESPSAVAAWRARVESSPDWLERCVTRTEGMIDIVEARLLYDLARKVKDGVIVEIGSYRGRSTTALACGSRAGAHVAVYAIDPHEAFVGVLGGRFGANDRRAFYRGMLDTGAWDLVRLVNLSSETITAGWTTPVALLWIDGDHRYAGVRRDFECWLPHLAPGAIVAFDDATDQSIGPWRLIDELTRDGRLTTVASAGKVRAFCTNGAQ